jgi:hypothetical protein
MNTIQISEKRISTSVHSAGFSSTNRVRIWNTPSPAAIASMAQAKYIDSAVVARSRRRNICFMISPFA